MAKKYVGFHPFAYDNEYYLYTKKEEAEKKKFVTFMEQRNAKYMTPEKEVYNNKKLEDTELLWESFKDNIEPPTPQLKVIDGYDSQEEIGGTDGNCGGDGENGENNNGLF